MRLTFNLLIAVHKDNMSKIASVTRFSDASPSEHSTNAAQAAGHTCAVSLITFERILAMEVKNEPETPLRGNN